MIKLHISWTVVFSIAVLALSCGCANDALDPTQIGRFRPTPVVNVILDSLGVADEPDPTYAGAEEPTPEDVFAYDQDYIFGAGDIVRVSIYELRQEGTPYLNDFVVTETGKISIPDVGQIRAAGLTESELEDEIEDILSPSILLEPSVTATLLQSQSRQFSIYGNGVGSPGRYAIPRYNFRLTEAIAVAGGVAEFNLSYIYISREITGREDSFSPSVAGRQEGPSVQDEGFEFEEVTPGPIDTADPEDELLEIIAPYARNGQDGNDTILSSAVISDRPFSFGTRDIVTRMDAESGSEGARIEWVFRDGKWEPIRVGEDAPTVSEPQIGSEPDPLPEGAVPLEESLSARYGWEQIGTGGKQIRVIQIPVDKLLGGDPKYNVIIRPGDSISVPVDLIGEFWVGGNVNSQGPISLTGRPLTLKMAIFSAGGLGPLAHPQKVEVIRRIGKNREEIVMVDLDKIAKGQQPDFFIKPYDTINVGTHGVSRWMAVLRNAFRAEYGFGFTYSRNFADVDFGNRIGPSWSWDDVKRIF